MEKKPELVEYINSDQVSVDVYAQEKEAKPVSKYLFGKFSEHMGRNIYHGKWAQILDNPSFEPGIFFGSSNQILENRLCESKENLSRKHVSEGFLDLNEEAKAFSIDLLGSFHDGVAYGWAKYGKGNASYSLVSDCVGSWTSQKIEVRSLKTSSVGILQPVFLPLHREGTYKLDMWVKGDAQKLVVYVETLGKEKKRLAQETITNIKSDKWKKHTKKFKVNTKGVERGQPLTFSIALNKPGTILIDHCFLFPADNIDGFDPDVVRLLKESGLTLLRYPGGNFVSQYLWKDGIGTIEKRPIRLNKAWNIAEYNYVGTDEFIKFCELIGCEPFICLNAGDGTPDDAAQWVEYCNGAADTAYGKIRAENGHPEPYGVKFWEIGNELYGQWQMGYCSAEEYAERYERFYRSMLKVDPQIKFIANGNDIDWNKVITQRKGSIIRSLSFHPLIGWSVPKETPPDSVYHSAVAYTYWFMDYLKRLRESVAEDVKEPKIAITELQIIRGYPPNSKTLTEVLYYSGIINDAIRQGDFVELVTHSALVNHGGGIGKKREIVYPEPVHHAQKLYATYATGKLPAKVSIKTPMFNVQTLYDIPAVKNVPYIDAMALLSQNEMELSLILCNREPEKSVKAKIRIHNFRAKKKIKTETISGPSYMSTNSWKESDTVKIVEAEAQISNNEMEYVMPPHSLTFLSFKAQ